MVFLTFSVDGGLATAAPSNLNSLSVELYRYYRRLTGFPSESCKTSCFEQLSLRHPWLRFDWKPQPSPERAAVYRLNEAMDGEVRLLGTGMFREPEADTGQTG